MFTTSLTTQATHRIGLELNLVPVRIEAIIGEQITPKLKVLTFRRDYLQFPAVVALDVCLGSDSGMTPATGQLTITIFDHFQLEKLTYANGILFTRV